MTAVSLKQATQELNTAFRGLGLPNKLIFVNGVKISRGRLIGQFPDVVMLKWINFYGIEFKGCIGSKVIIGDE